MNNEILRRKLFRTVLADSRSPTGILASSPEMVRTVQKRVGGAQAGSYELNLIPELVQRGDVRALQALTAPSYPKQVRLAASQALGSVTTKEAGSPTADFLSTSGQQLARGAKEAVSDALTDAGELGQGILDVADATNRGVADFVTTAARNDAERLSSLAQSVGDSDVASGFMQGVGNIGEALRKTFTPSGAAEARAEREALRESSPDDTRFERFVKSSPTLPDIVELAGDASEGILSAGRYLFTDTPYDTAKDDVSTDPRVRSPFTPGPIKVEEEQLDDEYVGISDQITPVSGVDTLTKTKPSDKDANGKNTASGDAKKTNLQLATELIDLRNQKKETSKSTLAQTTDPNVAANTANSIVNLQQEKKIDQKTKAETTDELLGIVPPGEEPTMKERMEARKALITELLGEDKAKDIRTDANYNLMMVGLMIAAGESPNALTNIAKGAAAGLQKYGEVVGEKAVEENKRERAIALQAIDEVRGEISTEKKQDYDAMVRQADQQFQLDLQETKDINALKRLERQLTAEEQKQIKLFDFKTKMADQSFEENMLMLGFKGDQAAALQEDAQAFKMELAEFAQNADSDDMKMVKAIQAAGELGFNDAYAIYKSKSTGRSTDEERRFAELIKAGVPASQALLYAGQGVTKALMEELGVEGAEQKLQSVMRGGPIKVSSLPQKAQEQIAERHKPGDTVKTGQGEFILTSDGNLVPARQSNG